MELERSRSFSVSMGNYESYKFHATLRVSHRDLGYPDDEVQAMNDSARQDLLVVMEDFVMHELTRQLISEIEDSAALTTERKSFIRSLVEPEPKARGRARSS